MLRQLKRRCQRLLGLLLYTSQFGQRFRATFHSHKAFIPQQQGAGAVKVNVINKFKDFMGLNEEEYSDYDETDSEAYRSEYQQPEPPLAQPAEPTESRGFRRTSERSASKINNVVGMPGIVHGVVVHPRMDVCSHWACVDLIRNRAVTERSVISLSPCVTSKFESAVSHRGQMCMALRPS